MAGTQKEGEAGQTLDLHALRRTFGTHLSKNDVATRTGQAAVGHSSLDLTMNVCSHPTLLCLTGTMPAQLERRTQPNCRTSAYPLA
jgi:hypothetical protein